MYTLLHFLDLRSLHHCLQVCQDWKKVLEAILGYRSAIIMDKQLIPYRGFIMLDRSERTNNTFHYILHNQLQAPWRVLGPHDQVSKVSTDFTICPCGMPKGMINILDRMYIICPFNHPEITYRCSMCYAECLEPFLLVAPDELTRVCSPQCIFKVCGQRLSHTVIIWAWFQIG